VRELRSFLEPPVWIGTVLKYSQLTITGDLNEVEAALEMIVAQLRKCVGNLNAPAQRQLFGGDATPCEITPGGAKARHSLTSLAELIAQGLRFPTVYADPPWAYKNEASRAAAVDNYSTRTVDGIYREPERELVEDNAHLHLWTTNGLLRNAFQIMGACGDSSSSRVSFGSRMELVWAATGAFRTSSCF